MAQSTGADDEAGVHGGPSARVHDGLAPDRAAALVDNARARKRLEKITVDLLGSLLD